MNLVSPEKSVRALLKFGIAQLREARVPSFTLAAELLLLHALERDRTWIYAHPEEIISAGDAARYFAFIARRAGGEPTQHLTRKQEFWGLEFEVTPEVLIPRPETEHVIEVALDRLAVRELRAGRPQKNDGAGLLIADIGTGSGCIAVALAKELPGAKIYATDISPKALEVARRNAARHGFSDRIHFVECNFLDDVAHATVRARYIAPLQGNAAISAIHESQVTTHESRSFDLIVSNPPYVGRREAATLPREVRDHEPEVALFGGEEGHELYAALIAQVAQHLKPGGILVLELAHTSLPAVQPLLDAQTWTNVGITNDLAGIPRVIAAERL
jgi:release factor glutamine methyltransferase